MLFQVLDAKSDCIGYFAKNQINSTTNLPTEGGTWEYSNHLGDGDYQIARIYANGATITDVCPEHMKTDWEEIKKTLRSCLKAFNTADLSLNDNCFYDVLPDRDYIYEFDYLFLNTDVLNNLDNQVRSGNITTVGSITQQLY